MEWMGGLIVFGVLLFLVWCFDLIGLLKRGLDEIKKKWS